MSELSPSHPKPLDRRYIAAALMLIMVLASMEQTITSTAMYTIIRDLGGLQHYSWVMSIYLLACTVSMPLYGRLADALGRKRVILGAIGLFLLSSLLAATAHSMVQLIIYRGLQGLGAGGIMPVVLTILGDLFTLEERAKIQGLFSAVWGTSSLAGPMLGAFLVQTLGWRWVFLVNLPLGLPGAIVLIWKYHDHEKPHSTNLDLPGIAAASVACLTLLLFVARLGPSGASTLQLLAFASAALASIAFFIRHERSAPNPIMPPNLMLQRRIGPAMAGSALLGLGFLSLDAFVPLYVQGGRGGGVMAAAGAVTPVILTWALSSFLAAPLLVRWGFRRVAVLGSSLIALGFLGLLLSSLFNAPNWAITAVLLITGFGLGPASMSFLLGAQDAVAWQQRGIITSNITFFRSIGGAVGIGMLGALFNHFTPGLSLDPTREQTLPPAALASLRQSISHGLIWVFAAMLLFALLQVAVTFLISGQKADHTLPPSETLEALGG